MRLAPEAMAHLVPLLRGRLASHPAAPAFAAEVAALHRRYAELVARHRLCPFLKDVDSGLGAFVVIFSEEPSVDEAVAVAAEVDAGVSHLVFPLVEIEPRAWERFGGAVVSALRARSPDASAIASFHPGMLGSVERPHTLTGLLRQAPDPFVQLVPPGLTEGGTVVITDLKSLEDIPKPPPDHAADTWRRLREGPLDQVLAELAELRAARAALYEPHLRALGALTPSSSAP